jgi:hypothetical protein
MHPVSTTPSYFSNIHLNIILPQYIEIFLMVSPSAFPTFLDLIIVIVFDKGYNLWAPHCAVFSNLLLFHPSCNQIFSAPRSQVLSVCVPPLMSETKFHPIKNYRKIIVLYVSGFILRQQMRRQKVLNWMVTGISQILYSLNFLMHQILIWYCHVQIYELCHIFKGSVSCL